MKFTSTNSSSGGGPHHRAEGGYILLVLILMVALLTIAAAAIAPSIAFQVKRDREEEMIHRGVQYSRAVQHYFKKFNRYPSKIEDLENTNNIRFLRKRYKDPITGQDFKVVHLSEVQLALAGGLVGGGLAPATAGPGAGNQFGQSANTFGLGNSPPTSAASRQGTNTAGANPTDAASSDPSTSGNANPGANQPGGAQPASDKLTGQTFGGGPIAGVVSTSKKQSIREFYKKDHYNEWLFIYNPQADMGGLIRTPFQPALAGAVPVGQPGVGQPGVAGVPGPPPGLGNQAPPFGGGMQQSPQTVQPQQQ